MQYKQAQSTLQHQCLCEVDHVHVFHTLHNYSGHRAMHKGGLTEQQRDVPQPSTSPSAPVSGLSLLPADMHVVQVVLDAFVPEPKQWPLFPALLLALRAQ
jgi:hypothetical protein